MSMKYRQVIEVSGRLSADVFNLPCVRACMKNNDGSVTYVLWISSLRHFGENTVTAGQRLCEGEDGYWYIEGEPLKKTKR